MMENELKRKMQEKKVKMKEMEETAALKAKLAEKDLNLQMLITLAEEFMYGNKKD